MRREKEGASQALLRSLIVSGAGAYVMGDLLMSGVSAAASEPELRIVAIGTSLTSRAQWPDQLETELAKCLGRPVHVSRVALAGSTTEWALTQLPVVIGQNPDIVLVELYANDSALNRFLSLSGSRRNMAVIAEGLRSDLPKVRLYVMAMNPFFGPRGWLRPLVDRYISAHRAAGAAASGGFIDFRPLWNAMPPSELAVVIPDGLHPKPEAATSVMVPELIRQLAPRCARPDAVEQ